jgi:regulator of replication initiation timing
MKQWLKKITGIEAKEQELAEERVRLEAEAESERKRLKESELELLKKKDPKEYATRTQQPWVAVLNTQINKENIRNGFFEIDWNEFFIKELILNGYGTNADPEEEIVDRWFRDIVFNMFAEEGLDTQRGSGYINVVPISKGKSEVS